MAAGSALRSAWAFTSALIRLGRPVFLGGGFLLYGLGAVVAWAAGHGFDGDLYLLGQAAVTAFQLMTHYANDYFDYEADVANTTPTRWSGGSRVLPSGELPLSVALGAALALAALGLLFTGLLWAAPGRGPLVVPALLVTALLSWAYSAPPLRLHGSGFGEIDVALVVTGLVPFLGFHLQAPDLSGWQALVWSVLPLALLQVAMLLAIEFPDEAGDRAVGKRTLVVRLGAERGARVYVAVLAVAFAALVIGAFLHRALPPRVALAGLLLAPLGAWRGWRVLRGDFRDPARFAPIAFWAVALLSFTAAAELIAWATLVRSA